MNYSQRMELQVGDFVKIGGNTKDKGCFATVVHVPKGRGPAITIEIDVGEFKDYHYKNLTKITAKEMEQEETLPSKQSSAPKNYDQVVVYTNCTVQVLLNTQTGECSIGWTRNENMSEDWIRQAHLVNPKTIFENGMGQDGLPIQKS